MALAKRCFVENPGLKSEHVLSRLAVGVSREKIATRRSYVDDERRDEAAGAQIVLDKSVLRDHHAQFVNRGQAGRLQF